MKISLNELKEKAQVNLSHGQIRHKFFLADIKTVSTIKKGHKLNNIITVKVTDIKKHPNADTLVLSQATNGQDSYQVITAATNLLKGAIVPLCLPNGKINNGTKIKETIIRDETSFGMYCAEEELGLADHSDGILILPTDTPIGVNYIEYAQLQDTIIEFPAEIAQNQNELIAKLMTILKKP
jgi:phenylalanyl-tRNA synthetase beta chain